MQLSLAIEGSPFGTPPGPNPHRLSLAVGVALDPPDGSGTKSLRSSFHTLRSRANAPSEATSQGAISTSPDRNALSKCIGSARYVSRGFGCRRDATLRLQPTFFPGDAAAAKLASEIFRVHQLNALDCIGSGNQFQSTTRNTPELGISAVFR